MGVAAHTPKDFKQQAAARCVTRLLTDSNCVYTDSRSNVSIRQLMALVWRAIHDDTTRSGALEDAQELFIEALYEIQRGYNLSETGADNKRQDRSICVAGTFNKLCEKLQGLHPDATVLFITQTGASLKLPIVVCEEAETYLKTLKPGSTDYLTLQEQLKDDNNWENFLWAMISNKVGARLLEEFGSLYPQGDNSNEFKEFLDAGLYALAKLDKDLLTLLPQADEEAKAEIGTDNHGFSLR